MKTYKLFEAMSKKDDNKHLFSYSGLIKSAWRKVINQAQDFYNIHFDLENNDCTGSRRTLNVSKNLRVDQPVKYTFNIEAWKAGGDWEYPVLYFKVELNHNARILASSFFKFCTAHIILQGLTSTALKNAIAIVFGADRSNLRTNIRLVFLLSRYIRHFLTYRERLSGCC